MDDNAYAGIEQLIADNEIENAQAALDAIEERGAHWHYLQCEIFIHKNWHNEARKQIEIALESEPDNELYKQVLEKLKESGAQPPKDETRDLPEIDKDSRRRSCKNTGCACCGYCCADACCQFFCDSICNGCG